MLAIADPVACCPQVVHMKYTVGHEAMSDPYHVGIINWPHGVPWPGSAINVRGLYTDELKLLISRERVNEALALHARPPLADTELEDHVYPTIVALDGTFFLVVS